MRVHYFLCVLLVVMSCVTGCKPRRSAPGSGQDEGISENIDRAEMEVAAKLKVAIDPVAVEMEAFSKDTRKLFDDRRFEDLEKLAVDLRASQSLFRDGSWKIRQFYTAMEPSDEEPDRAWKAVDKIHREWLQAKPGSITAHVAHANFYVNYAWFVRGSGYASSVSERENFSFEKRLESALKLLKACREFPEKDPMWWKVALTTALGQGWSKTAFDQIVDEAVAFTPTYYGNHIQRATSLLPRWYGEPGDWENYALQAAERKGGLGVETYARIVISMRPLHEQIFRESKASWPMTKEGLQQLRAKYPDSLQLTNEAALLATMASDQAYANEMFDLLGDAYLPSVFPQPERFAHYRHWAQTGSW